MTKTKFVYVTYDPLLEKIICVHEKPELFCKKCKKLSDENRDFCQIEEFKLKLVPKEELFNPYEDD